MFWLCLALSALYACVEIWTLSYIHSFEIRAFEIGTLALWSSLTNSWLRAYQRCKWWKRNWFCLLGYSALTNHKYWPKCLTWLKHLLLELLRIFSYHILYHFLVIWFLILRHKKWARRRCKRIIVGPFTSHRRIGWQRLLLHTQCHWKVAASLIWRILHRLSLLALSADVEGLFRITIKRFCNIAAVWWVCIALSCAWFWLLLGTLKTLLCCIVLELA